MGIFSTSSPFDEIVVKATQETNTKEDWALILDICDRVGTSATGPKECLRAIVKRLNHQDPHVIVQAVTLLDACVSNCGLPFHLEIASRDFEQEFCKLINKIQEKAVKDKLLVSLQKWSESEFKSDPQLDLIPSLVSKLKSKGVDFPSSSPHKSKKSGSHHHKSRDTSGSHHATSSSGAPQQEDADLAKAIELSLKEAQTNNQNKSLYPQTSLGGNASLKDDKKEPTKVTALYDFEAAEENELTFYAGEIVFVTDDTDQNWWHGSNQRGKGLFPANFVTTDLSVEPTKFEVATKKTVQFAEDVEVQSIETEPEVVELDEAKIDRVLHMLHEADPTGEVGDPLELAGLEDHVNQMGPLIDQELEKIDRRHAQLTRLGGELVEALNMYHNLMREPVGQTSMPSYNGIMPGPAVSMPHFPPVLNAMTYSGYASFNPNVPYHMVRPPHSAPAGSEVYNSMPQYQQNGQQQQVQHPPHSTSAVTEGYNSMPQYQQNGQQVPQPPNSMGIPNGQIGSQQQQPPNSMGILPNGQIGSQQQQPQSSAGMHYNY